MADLITRARAKYNLNNLATTAAEDTTLDALVTACSKAITNYCHREFAATEHDELYHGNREPILILRHYPVLAVQRVAYAPTTVLFIENLSDNNQRATVRVTATGLDLTRVASGVSTTASLAFTDYPTLAALAAAVNALGNGWTALVLDSRLNNRASSDLRSPQGAMNAIDELAEGRLHIRELSIYDIDSARGYLLRAGFDFLGPQDQRNPVWFGGFNYWRIIYTAGFTTVPEDVQEACAQWVASLFWQTKRDPGLAHESIPGLASRTPFPDMPASVKTLLRPYRNLRV